LTCCMECQCTAYVPTPFVSTEHFAQIWPGGVPLCRNGMAFRSCRLHLSSLNRPLPLELRYFNGLLIERDVTFGSLHGGHFVEKCIAVNVECECSYFLTLPPQTGLTTLVGSNDPCTCILALVSILGGCHLSKLVGTYSRKTF